jgi:transcriptional regulator with XRE-family HTH domain
MPSHERRLSRAEWQMRRDVEEAARELRMARLREGLTLRRVGQSAQMSFITIHRTERAERPWPRPEMLARHAAAVGLRARIKLYPGDDPIRDAGQVALIRRLRERIGQVGKWEFEVPIPQMMDQRAIDAVLTLPAGRVGFEAWVRLADAQAQLRAAHLKQRDAELARMVVVVKATHANRRALAAAGAGAFEAFPGSTRRILAALSAGQIPDANGVVLI